MNKGEYYLLLNTDSDSLKLRNVPPSNEKLHSCVFLFFSTAQNFIYGEQCRFEVTCDVHVILGHCFGRNQSQCVMSCSVAKQE